MKDTTTAAIKAEIGYTEEAPGTCRTCWICSEKEDEALPGTIRMECRVAADVGAFEVVPTGRCQRYMPRGGKKF